MSERWLQHSPSQSRRTCDWRFFFTKRRLLVVIALGVVGLYVLWRRQEPVQHIDIPKQRPPLRTEEPPTWEWLRKYEERLPQHDLSLPLPDGPTARYLRFQNQAQNLGWNNVLTEL